MVLAVIWAALFASPAWRFKFADNPLTIMRPLLASGGASVAIAIIGAIGTVVWDKIGSKEQAPVGWKSRGDVRIATKRPKTPRPMMPVQAVDDNLP